MFAELLRTKKKISEKEKKEYLEIIEGESERLTRLINNVLDYSRIERGVKEYSFSEVGIKGIAEKVLNSMMFQLKQHGFEIETDLPDDELIVQADGDALQEALVNLIANSIKYSTTKKMLNLKVKNEGNSVHFAVSDKGIGIPKEEQQKIFDIFFRSENKSVQSSGGAGLGLSIVNHIVRAHNGNIDVHSRPGEGSTFTLKIPKKK
jgi:two-component system phosphate regulon sensor histidine kinase PhoR